VPGRTSIKPTFAVIRPLQQQAEFKFLITSGFPPSENYCDSYWDGFFGFLIIWLYMKESGGNARFLFFVYPILRGEIIVFAHRFHDRLVSYGNGPVCF